MVFRLTNLSYHAKYFTWKILVKKFTWQTSKLTQFWYKNIQNKTLMILTNKNVYVIINR